jgi:predicted nucleic acid-binding protein
MVLVDTSVWVFHFREASTKLAGLLDDGRVWCHTFIIGELACVNLKDRAVILSYLELLPRCIEADHQEVLSCIENNRLMGQGLGYVDVHLITSAVLSGVSVWTLDKKLALAVDSLHIRYK